MPPAEWEEEPSEGSADVMSCVYFSEKKLVNPAGAAFQLFGEVRDRDEEKTLKKELEILSFS